MVTGAHPETGPDLRHHGDREVAAGLVDLAVNVRLPRPPDWLRERLVRSLDTIAAYPDPTGARVAVAARHGRRISEALVTAGAAEAFSLVARALRPGVDVRHAVVVHPQFTEPEVALAEAGHQVHRLLLDASGGFRFDAARVDERADLVVIGNPTNPTSVLHPARELRRLVRPGRILLVDEAFMDAVPGEVESLAGTELPGLLVVRSLTKTWGLAGLRAGYVVGDEALIARLAAAQPPWSVSTPAAVAVTACLEPAALRIAEDLAAEGLRHNGFLLDGLDRLGVTVVGPPAGPFLLIRVAGSDGAGVDVRRRLRQAGYAVRRGDSFPGLGPQWIRVAVRAPEVSAGFLAALSTILTDRRPAAGRVPADPANLGMPGTAEPARPGAAGRVTLVGAGPGDEGLITVRGQQRLAEADVVVADRLVPRSLLDNLGPGVRIIDVAKTPRAPATSQEQINEILVDHALAGRRVVRLKGGDPFVFGRGMEEIEACAAAGVPVEVVPGVSSAIAAPALAGIPVTHRGLSQGFTVISAHVPPGDPQSTVDWSAVARTGTSIVLMMAVHTLPAVAAALLGHGLDPATPAACVENGGTPRQRVLTGTLARIAGIAADAGLRAPAITVIGPVATFAAPSPAGPPSPGPASPEPPSPEPVVFHAGVANTTVPEGELSMDIPDLLAGPITPRSTAAEAAARERLDALVKPLGALGRLEDIGAWLAGAQDRCPPAPLDRVRVVVFAGDHGVADEGVSAYPREVTAAMVAAFLGGFAGVSVLARGQGAHIRVLDLGVRVDLPDVGRFKVRRGSGDISREDALTAAEVATALAAGAAIADEEIAAGADLLIGGDMGIGNTTVAAAMVAAVLGLTGDDVVGTGTGVSGPAFVHKRMIIDRALARPRAGGPVAILAALGSADAAATVGFLIRAAARSTPVLLDGVFSCACALVAARIAPDAADWWLAGHRSTEASQGLALRELGLRPVLDLGMRLGEGSGALLALPVVRSAQALLAEMGTLADLDLGDATGSTTEPTAEPTAEPTIAPTAEPTAGAVPARGGAA